MSNYILKRVCNSTHKLYDLVSDWYESTYKIKRIVHEKRKAQEIFSEQHGRLRIWELVTKYNLLGVEGLINMTGKKRGPYKKGWKKRESINILDDHDREIYQEVMESILEDHGVDPKEIRDKMKKRKEEGNSKANNTSKLAKRFRNSGQDMNYTYTKTIKQNKRIKYHNPEIMSWILREGYKSMQYLVR